MNEGRFWNMIEDAWLAVGGKTKDREKLSQGKLTEAKACLLEDALEEVIPRLSEALSELSQDELLAFDRILELKLYQIDRAEIQEVTDGSDDGFLYARGFIVACGKRYYDSVNANPTIAMTDLQCEEICYLSTHAYEDRFGDMPESDISRESCSNEIGWPKR